MEYSMKKLLLAGIGTMAVTYEKAEAMVNELVKKGEIAVNEGKELNEELKRKIDSSGKTEKNQTMENIKKMVSELQFASKKDIEDLKNRIDELEKNSTPTA